MTGKATNLTLGVPGESIEWSPFAGQIPHYFTNY